MERIIKEMKTFLRSRYVKIILSKEDCKTIIDYYEKKGKKKNEKRKNNTQG